MMYSAYELNKQNDNIQPWYTPFPIWNQSVVPCPVLTVASWPAYTFLKRQVRWSDIPIYLIIFQFFFLIHTIKDFGIVNKTDVDVFLELSCFFDDPMDVGNLISGSSAFSKSSLSIWKFMVHVLLKPDLENYCGLQNPQTICLYYIHHMEGFPWQEENASIKGERKSGGLS